MWRSTSKGIVVRNHVDFEIFNFEVGNNRKQVLGQIFPMVQILFKVDPLRYSLEKMPGKRYKFDGIFGVHLLSCHCRHHVPFNVPCPSPTCPSPSPCARV